MTQNTFETGLPSSENILLGISILLLIGHNLHWLVYMNVRPIWPCAFCFTKKKNPLFTDYICETGPPYSTRAYLSSVCEDCKSCCALLPCSNDRGFLKLKMSLLAEWVCVCVCVCAVAHLN